MVHTCMHSGVDEQVATCSRHCTVGLLNKLSFTRLRSVATCHDFGLEPDSQIWLPDIYLVGKPPSFLLHGTKCFILKTQLPYKLLAATGH